ncbi:hypothetical protein ONZ45_g15089 [Pleurotus djamor]|nr:hypothetical protein ONZ45_g15089 [Pleurotus djamor]
MGIASTSAERYDRRVKYSFRTDFGLSRIKKMHHYLSDTTTRSARWDKAFGRGSIFVDPGGRALRARGRGQARLLEREGTSVGEVGGSRQVLVEDMRWRNEREWTRENATLGYDEARTRTRDGMGREDVNARRIAE